MCIYIYIYVCVCEFKLFLYYFCPPPKVFKMRPELELGLAQKGS